MSNDNTSDRTNDRTAYQRGHRDSLQAFGADLLTRHKAAHNAAWRSRSVAWQTLAKLRRAGLSDEDAERLRAGLEWPPTAMFAAAEALEASHRLPEDPEALDVAGRWSSTT